jgi:hypothetical protein
VIHPEHHGSDRSITGNSAPVGQGGDGGKAEIHDRTGLYLAIIGFGFSCMAIGASLILPQLYTARADAQAVRIEALSDRTRTAEREARVMQERWNDLKVELAKKGISVSDH